MKEAAQDFLSIGEIARICQVTAKTLCHYDSIGLLKPQMVDPLNGYRYYDKRQTAQVNLIRELQGLGFSLEKLEKVFNNVSGEKTLEKLKHFLEEQQEQTIAQIDLLQENLEKIKNLSEGLGDYPQDDELPFSIRTYSERSYYFSKVSDQLQENTIPEAFVDLTYQVNHRHLQIKTPFPTLIRNGKYGNIPEYLFGVEMKNEDQELQSFTAGKGKYACFVFKGQYRRIMSRHLEELFQLLRKNSLKPSYPVLEVFYVNEAMTVNEKNYLTEIQIKIGNP